MAAEVLPMALRESFSCVAITRADRTVSSDKITHFTYGDKFASAFHPGGELLLQISLEKLEAEFEGEMVRAHRSLLVRKALIRSLKPRKGTCVFDLVLEGVQAPLQVSRAGRRTVLSARPDLCGGAA